MNMIFFYSYRLILVFLAVFIWFLMCWAHRGDYDENYGYFINAMLMSIASSLIIIVGWIWKRKLVIKNKIFGIIFLIIASPLSILLFIYLYQFFIGQYFKV